MSKVVVSMAQARTLRECRTARNLSQFKLALLTGIAPANISNIECGKQYAHPGWRKRLAKALDVSEKDVCWGGVESERGD